LFDLAGVTIPAVAAAQVHEPEHPVPYALMAMNPGDCANMFFGGQPEVILTGAANSYTESLASCPNDDHFRVEGISPLITTDGEHHVRGEASGCGPPGNFDTCVHNSAGDGNTVENFEPDLDDPWGHCPSTGCPPGPLECPADDDEVPNQGICVPVPDYTPVDCSSGANDVSFTNDGSLPPGVYCHLAISGAGTEVVLTGAGANPGVDDAIYVFQEGVTLDGGSGTRLTSNGNPVLIYMTCASGSCEADPYDCCDGSLPEPFEIRGDDGTLPKLHLTGHPEYEDIIVFVDRSGSGDITCQEASGGQFASVSLTGQGDVVLDGSVYAIGTTVDFGGLGEADYELNGTIVGNRICFRGQATYTVDWSLTVPPEDSEKLFLLVE
jgi:hypothetical protein